MGRGAARCSRPVLPAEHASGRRGIINAEATSSVVIRMHYDGKVFVPEGPVNVPVNEPLDFELREQPLRSSNGILEKAEPPCAASRRARSPWASPWMRRAGTASTRTAAREVLSSTPTCCYDGPTAEAAEYGSMHRGRDSSGSRPQRRLRVRAGHHRILCCGEPPCREERSWLHCSEARQFLGD